MTTADLAAYFAREAAIHRLSEMVAVSLPDGQRYARNRAAQKRGRA